MIAKPIMMLFIVALFAVPGIRPQTQSDLNTEAAQELRTAEAEMNSLLENLTRKAGNNRDALAKLNRAQSAWVAYREAHLAAMWPSATPQADYGSVHPMCVLHTRTALTKVRIEELKSMLTVEEGEVCLGKFPN